MRVTKLLRRTEASQYLKTTWGINRAAPTLATDAMSGRGPAYTCISHRAFYTTASLDAWAKLQMCAPSSKAKQIKRTKRTKQTTIGNDVKQEIGDGAVS